MKTMRCNLTKACRISQPSQNHYKRIWGYFLTNLKKFHLFIEELYAVHITGIYSKIEFVSILT